MTKKVALPEKLPKLIVFDLDYTIWPEWIDCTYGPPYQYDKKSNRITDRNGEQLVLFKDITAVFALIHSFPPFKTENKISRTKIAIASRSSTPEWAEKALTLFTIPELDDATLHDKIAHMEIYPKKKTVHFEALKKATGIDYKDMLFFDDEQRNREVAKLGVHFVLVDTRYGVSMDIFRTSLTNFAKNA